MNEILEKFLTVVITDPVDSIRHFYLIYRLKMLTSLS